MKVIRVRTSQDAMKGRESDIQGENLVMDRVVYKILSSLTDNKVITNPTGTDSEYDRFLLDMEKIHRGETVHEATDALDEYLALLGVTEQYPFPQDTYSLAQWITYPTQEPYRNVIAKVDGVDYNVITNIDGVDYNVIHDTSAQTIGARNGR